MGGSQSPDYGNGISFGQGIKQGIGYGLEGLAFLDSLRRPGGIGQFMQQRALIAENPEARAGLQGSPLLSAFFGIGGQQAPQYTPAQEVTQETPMGTVSGLSGTPAERALTRAGVRPGEFTPRFPPLSSGAAARQELIGAARQGLSAMTPQQLQQAGLEVLGIKHPVNPLEMIQALGPNWKPVRLNTGTGNVTLAPAGEGTEPVPPGYSVYGGKLYRTSPLPKAGGAGEKISDAVLQAWAAGVDPMQGGAPASPSQQAAGKKFVEGRRAQKAEEATSTALAKPLGPTESAELGTIKTISDLIDQTQNLLTDPTVQQSVGLVSGRVGFAKYKLGAASFPLEEQFTTLRELIRVMAVGRLARSAGSRSYLVWQELDKHPPQAGDSLELLQSKMATIKAVLTDTAQNAAKVYQTPRGEALGLFPKTPGLQGLPGAGGTPAPQGGDLRQQHPEWFNQ